MSRWQIKAPAKLTWSLEVTGVRPDGFHELRSEMVTLDLADELVIDDHEEGLEIVDTRPSRDGHLSTGPANLVSQALTLAGRRAQVRLTKVIPVGGGLGGGSADAGAILRWAGFDDLLVASQLGGDVPFCRRGGRALVEGIGEVVTPLVHEDRTVVLLLPPFGVETAACYRAFDRLTAAGLRPEGRNHLLQAACEVEPRLNAWRKHLGAVTGGEVVLAGSGSTLFVEGSLATLGLAETRVLEVDGERGVLVEASTVPAEWAEPELS